MSNTDDFRGSEQKLSQQGFHNLQSKANNTLRGRDHEKEYAGEYKDFPSYNAEPKASVDYARVSPPRPNGALSQMLDRIEKENAAKEEIIQLLTDVFHRMTGDHPQQPDPIPENDRDSSSILVRLDDSISLMGRKNSKLYAIVDQLSKLI
jgi:hypothetical protein